MPDHESIVKYEQDKFILIDKREYHAIFEVQCVDINYIVHPDGEIINLEDGVKVQSDDDAMSRLLLKAGFISLEEFIGDLEEEA